MTAAYKEYSGYFHDFVIICAKTKVGKDARKFLGERFERRVRKDLMTMIEKKKRIRIS
ncbi:MAG: hypothetical protein IJ571_08730 [Ruminococcus sp.]|nr:hypothetical protein [Ruminococcus sp.]